MSDEEFWVHWIADTPEEEEVEEHSGCGWIVILMVALIVGAGVIAVLL